MTQMTPAQITAALEAGIITQEQADNMARANSPGARSDIDNHEEVTIGNEEDLRFIRGFSDIFITIGLGLLLLGLSTITGLSGSGGLFLIAAAIVYAMAEYFGRKKRAHLPTLIITIAFLIFMFIGVGSLIAELGGFNNVGGAVLTAFIMLIAMIGYYARIRLPFCIAIITYLSLSLIVTLLMLVMKDFVLSNAGAFMILAGLITLALGIFYDSKDQHRTTRFSDNAFWLHLTAAPLLIHGAVFTLLGGASLTKGWFIPNSNVGEGHAIMILLFVGIMTCLGLILNRRALIVSSLLYALIAVGYLLFKIGINGTMALTLTLILIGAAITLLGVGWHPVRNIMIRALPQNRYIPAPYDPSLKTKMGVK